MNRVIKVWLHIINCNPNNVYDINILLNIGALSGSKTGPSNWGYSLPGLVENHV